jgi:predicted small integral membrane protein
MVCAIALFFSIVAFNNIIDFNSDFLFVQHVLSMDNTFQSPSLMGRAITDPTMQKYAYIFIIAWEAMTALVCWIGAFILLFNIRQTAYVFNQSRTIAFIGLFFGFLLYMVGFIIIGGEWFCMWQSKIWNGQTTAGMFVSLILFVMIFLQHNEEYANTNQ